MNQTQPSSTGTILFLLLAFVLGFLALWADPTGSTASQELSVSTLLGRPSEYWGRSVRVVGSVTASTDEGYRLTDRSGGNVAIRSPRAPKIGTDVLVVGIVGQDPANALRPVLAELDRDSLQRSVESVVVAVLFVLTASGLGIFLVVRADRRLRRQSVAGGSVSGSSSRGLILRVEILQGPDQGKIFEFDQPEIPIGRPGERPNAISLSDMTISRTQGRIVRQGAGFVFENESATNPTRINGQVVPKASLLSGDRLEMGESLLKIVLQPKPESSPMTAARWLVSAVIFLLMANGAGAAPKLNVETVDVRALPELTVQFTVREVSGEGVNGLRSEDFRMTLDGEPLNGLAIGPSTISQERNVVFVLENSGRLRGKDFFQIRNLIVETIDRLSPRDQVGLIAVSDRVEVISELTTDRSAFKMAIAELGLGGDSILLNTAIRQALDQLKNPNRGPSSIIVLSSGQSIADTQARETMVDQAREQRIPVHVFAAALRFDSPELTTYADLTGGRFYPEPISTNAIDLAKRSLTAGSGRYSAQVRLQPALDGRPHHAVLELFILGQSVNQEFSFLMSTGSGVPPETMTEYFRRAAARQSWWMVYFGAILGGLVGVYLRDRMGLRSTVFRLIALMASLATGALLGFVFSRLGAL